MSTKHTPGPWTASRDGLHQPGAGTIRWHSITGADGNLVATTASVNDEDREAAEADAADARLLAAAPELLDALRAIKATLEQPVFDTGTETPEVCRILRGDAAHAWEHARAALAKATGEGA